jgi:hypothetical protein
VQLCCALLRALEFPTSQSITRLACVRVCLPALSLDNPLSLARVRCERAAIGQRPADETVGRRLISSVDWMPYPQQTVVGSNSSSSSSSSHNNTKY